MLSTLFIKNLALIEEQTIEFGAGLNMVTGETGAGKSILIGAMQLLLGERADKSLIRSGAASCELGVALELDARPDLLAAVNEVLADAGVPACENGQLIGSRRISESSSRNFVNSSPVTLQVLRQLGDLLVDVHGPYDNQSLLKTARQLAVLDAYAGQSTILAACKERFHAWRALKDQLLASRDEVPSPELVEFLRFQAGEIERAELKPGDDVELSRRHEVAANAQAVLEILDRSHEQLVGDEDSLTEQIGDLRRGMFDLERVDEEAGRRFGKVLDALVAQVQDLAADLNAYQDQVDIDPEEFEELEDRLGLVNRLKRKYGGSVESALEHAADCRRRLKTLEHFDEYQEELKAKINTAETELRKYAEQLSKARRKAAKDLAPRITEKLSLLGFPDADFAIKLVPAELSANGADAVEFFFAPNPGEGSRPLREIASSGEIARVMLALKTVLAKADQTPLLIFDEVDANVGGKVAHKVGEELSALGRDHQIICITHQPPVAAGGSRHFTVSKKTRKKRTVAEIKALTEDERVAEIARMLGGEKSDPTVAGHARQLLARTKS